VREGKTNYEGKNEWGYVTNGSVLISAVEHTGKNTAFKASAGDIWYFPSSKMSFAQAPGGGGSFLKVDSTNFPIAKDLAANNVEVLPRGLGKCIGILILFPLLTCFRQN
jgi:hypothetical protein